MSGLLYQHVHCDGKISVGREQFTNWQCINFFLGKAFTLIFIGAKQSVGVAQSDRRPTNRTQECFVLVWLNRHRVPGLYNQTMCIYSRNFYQYMMEKCNHSKFCLVINTSKQACSQDFVKGGLFWKVETTVSDLDPNFHCS